MSTIVLPTTPSGKIPVSSDPATRPAWNRAGATHSERYRMSQPRFDQVIVITGDKAPAVPRGDAMRILYLSRDTTQARAITLPRATGSQREIVVVNLGSAEIRLLVDGSDLIQAAETWFYVASGVQTDVFIDVEQGHWMVLR